MSQRTLERAKRALQIVSKKYYESWYWCLPGQDPRARFGGLRPLDEVSPEKEAVLEPLPPEERLGPMDDGLMIVREGMSERQILRQARKALKGELVGRRPETSPRPRIHAPPSPLRGGGSEASGDGDVLAADPSSPASGGEGGKEGKAARSGSAPGSRRFDPTPAGCLELVVRVNADNSNWIAALTNRLEQLREMTQSWITESAQLEWVPDWTGPVGDGLMRLVFVPRGVPPDRLARLAAWAKETLPECEAARLAA